MKKWDAADEPGEHPADPRGSSRGRFAAGTPEDVAALYTWANLQGARYRDFSASRKRYREQVRAQASNLSSREASGQADSSAVAGLSQSGSGSVSSSLEERRRGGSAVRWAANERRWESSSGALNREDLMPRAIAVQDSLMPHGAGRNFERDMARHDLLWAERTGEAFVRADAEQVTEGKREHLDSMFETGGLEDDPLYDAAADLWSEDRWERVDTPATEQNYESTTRSVSGAVKVWSPELDTEEEIDRPAWLYGTQPEVKAPVPAAILALEYPGEATPEASRRGRWLALREVMEGNLAPHLDSRVSVSAVTRAPLLVIFSLAGGVGRTSLLSTLGRALSANGERVLLGDAAPFSLLPFYFGARDLRPGERRAFAPPAGSDDSPITLANYDLGRLIADRAEQRHMVSEILRDGAECHRILLDLPASAEWLLRRIATLQPTVLVPLLPDMTSVISLEAVERYLEDMVDGEGVPIQPFYVLNQFDESMALHRDIHDLLRKRLGERLLNTTICRSGAVSEALAEGMTVADYAPESPVTRHYFELAAWLQTVSPAVMPSARMARSS